MNNLRSVSENELFHCELSKLKEKCDSLVQNNDKLRSILEMEAKENEIQKKSIHDLSQKLEIARKEELEPITEFNVVKKKQAGTELCQAKYNLS